MLKLEMSIVFNMEQESAFSIRSGFFTGQYYSRINKTSTWIDRIKGEEVFISILVFLLFSKKAFRAQGIVFAQKNSKTGAGNFETGFISKRNGVKNEIF